MATHIDREFAGQVRRFELLSTEVLPFEDEKHGNLAIMAMRGARGVLGVEDVRHILAHSLASGRASRFPAAMRMVDEAMRGRPLTEFVPLAVDIVTAAFGGET